MKIAVVVDSTFYTMKEKFEAMNVHVVPLTVHIDNISYTEKNDNLQQNMELFDKIYEGKKLATTSQPTTDVAVKMYEFLADEGYEKIISFHISSGISGTFQGMKIAADTVMETRDISIEVFDTKLAAQAATLIIESILEVIAEENDINTEEIEKIIKHYQEKIKIYFVVDNLDFLAYGGRINQQIASLGNLFSIQPILTLKDGKIDKFTTVRSTKKIVKVIEEEFIANGLDKKSIAIRGVYTSNDKLSSKLVKSVTVIHKGHIASSENSVMGIVIANHLGPNAYGIMWCEKY